MTGRKKDTSSASTYQDSGIASVGDRTVDQYEMTIDFMDEDEREEYRKNKPFARWSKGQRLIRSLFFQQPDLICLLQKRKMFWPEKNIHYKLFDLPRTSTASNTTDQSTSVNDDETRTSLNPSGSGTGNGLSIPNIKLRHFDPKTFGSPSYRNQMRIGINANSSRSERLRPANEQNE